jgi:hypothetical protein
LVQIEQVTGPCKSISNPIKVARDARLPIGEEESKETTDYTEDFFGLEEEN